MFVKSKVMQVDGTKQAFNTLINQRGIYKQLGVDRRTVAGWKLYLKKGKSLSTDKMEEVLFRGGASVIHDKTWYLDTICYDGLEYRMADFYEELDNINIGDTVEADISDNMDFTLITNAVYKTANRLGSKILFDGDDRPVYRFTFQ